jgi:hypothetical protein
MPESATEVLERVEELVKKINSAQASTLKWRRVRSYKTTIRNTTSPQSLDRNDRQSVFVHPFGWPQDSYISLLFVRYSGCSEFRFIEGKISASYIVDGYEVTFTLCEQCKAINIHPIEEKKDESVVAHPEPVHPRPARHA